MTSLLSTATVLAAEAGGAPAGTPAGAPAGQQPPAGLGPMLFQMLPIILIVVAFFWLMNRSQRKRDRERKEMLEAIRPRDDVVTIGGIEGRVVRVDGDSVVLRIDPEKDVKVTMAKSGISRKITKGEEQQ